MNSNIKRILIFLSAAYFLTLLSCSNDSLQVKEDSKEYGYISLGNTTYARSSVVPESDEVLLSKLTNVALICVWSSPGAEPVTSSISGATWTEFIAQFADPGYPLQTGTYSFTLTATLKQNISGSGVSFQGIKNDSIVAGTTKTLNFTLSPTSATTGGGIDITWNITQGSPELVKFSLKKLSDGTISTSSDDDLGSNTSRFFTSDLAPGEYELTADFMGYEEDYDNPELPPLSTWKGNVRVVAGITTTKTIDWALDSVYTITWNLNSGTISDATYVKPLRYTRRSNNIVLPTAAQMTSPTEGYAFAGWYGTSDFSDSRITSIPKGSTNNKTLYARYLPIYAIVDGVNYATLEDTQAAIRTATGNISVVLTSNVTRSDIRIDDFSPNQIVDSNTISDALRHTTASGISLSVRSGDTITLADDCGYLFYDASKLSSINLTGFDTTNATGLYGMFCNCSSLTSLDLSSLNTSTVTSFMALFNGCSSLQSITFGDNFDTSSATSMHMMFSGCSSLESIDLSGFDTSGADNFTNMFTNCSSLTQLDIRSFSAGNSNVGASSMFSGCTNLEKIIVSYDFATHLSGLPANKSSQMFNRCIKLVGGAGTPFNSSYTDSTYARMDGGPDSATPGYLTVLYYVTINGTPYLTLQDSLAAIAAATGDVNIVLGPLVDADVLGKKGTSNTLCYEICRNSTADSISLSIAPGVTIKLKEDSSSLFYQPDAKIVSLDLRGFDTSEVKKFGDMFNRLLDLTYIDVSTFVTTNATTFGGMFLNCRSLTTLDLSSFVTNENLSVVSNMFCYCSNLTTIYATDSFVSDHITISSSRADMFKSCTSLQGGAGTPYDSEIVDNTYARVDGGPGSETPGYFTLKTNP